MLKFNADRFHEAKAWLHQTAAHQVEGLLAGVLANPASVAGEFLLHHLSALAVAYADVDQADGLFIASAARTGDAGYT